ncbi:transcription factor BHLH3-like [Zingiber officinale]|uniref:transcription factor BHLH3-like n=1 Tax=Zingiber officinale TaxID=94328 RepID=UPI001C4C402A|nr:transcription factor BHLH3-like [Zingiber officinale]
MPFPYPVHSLFSIIRSQSHPIQGIIVAQKIKYCSPQNSFGQCKLTPSNPARVMEFEEESFLEELLALRREAWDSYPVGMSELLLPTEGNIGCSREISTWSVSPDDCDNQQLIKGLNSDSVCFPAASGGGLSAAVAVAPPQSISATGGTVHANICFLEQKKLRRPSHEEMAADNTKAIQAPSALVLGSRLERRNGKSKKVDGVPSKNLMAERRRRKRLNDRLSMLRSVVPKISKMDRTAILADTIDYMKELLEKLKDLQAEADADADVDPNQANDLLGLGMLQFNSSNIQVPSSNSPKFEVERRDADTRIGICCGMKPGLLVSTLSTMEALGLEVEQCVVSCFSDFGMRASCSDHDNGNRERFSSEDIKQELFRAAGCGRKF